MARLARMLALLMVCLVICVTSQAFGAVIRVKWDSANDGPGNDWDHTYHTVTAGLAAASAGDEVWVAGDAAHPYVERITLKAGTGLYGGFAGTETERGQRDWRTNVTVLDANWGGRVVTSPSGATTNTIVDGFTIRNGSATSGAGVYCMFSSPTISSNAIVGNSGGGIYCYSSSPRIWNNTITANSDGICCDYSSGPRIVNNTIAANSVGISLLDLPYGLWISNNIIAFNAEGVSNYSGSGTTSQVLESNCVYNPGGANYTWLSTGPRDIQTDPKLVAVQYGRFHIQPDSPCRDAGDIYSIQPGWVDMDGQPRCQGESVDIGADESDGTNWDAAPAIVRVSPSGDDANNGSSWALSKRTVQSGLNAASAQGGEVWVAAGTYGERIVLTPYAHLYAGFGGTESSRSERNWIKNIAVLDGSGADSVIRVLTGYRVSTIDGFTIRNGKASAGGGMLCTSASPTISNNNITANTASATGGGVCCRTSLAVISNNRITGNSATNGAGMSFYNCFSGATVSGNTIAANTASASGGGVYCFSHASPSIVNNTIAGNTAASGGGICCVTYSPPACTNNILALNSSGVYKDSGSHPILTNNCVYNPSGYNYSGLTAGTGDISLDPLLTSDYHLRAGSPCINAGWNDALGLPATDFDGEMRIMDTIVDIGADEYPFGTTAANSKLARDGAAANIGSAIVSAAFPDFFYIEAADRTSGVKVDKTGHGLSAGMKAGITGTVQTNADGERYIAAATAAQVGTGAVNPLALTNKALGGGPFGLQSGIAGAFGLNNIGLLVRTCGKYTYVDEHTFTIDDGSGVNVKCVVPSGVIIDPGWSYVSVTGISSCEKIGAELRSMLRVREQGDIVSL